MPPEYVKLQQSSTEALQWSATGVCKTQTKFHIGLVIFAEGCHRCMSNTDKASHGPCNIPTGMPPEFVRGSTHTSRKVVGSCTIRYPRVEGGGADLLKGGRSVSGGPLRGGSRVLCFTIRYAPVHQKRGSGEMTCRTGAGTSSSSAIGVPPEYVKHRQSLTEALQSLP